MSRSTKKGPYVDERLFEKVEASISSGNVKPIKTWARASTITPEFIGVTLDIHNGKKFIRVYISEHMVGHKVGEFAPTRTFKGHGASHTKEVASLT